MQTDGMKQKIIVSALTVFILFSMLTSLLHVEVIRADVLPKFYVDDDYNATTPGWHVDHFAIIQEAINKAISGDRIIVYAGTYNESLTINKKLDLFGEQKTTTIIDGNQTGDVLTISATLVNISHFTLRNSTQNNSKAIIRITADHAIITDNIIQDGYHGISLEHCGSSLIYDNIIQTNLGDGIWANQSNENEITYNTITDNRNGLFFYSSDDNTLEYNTIEDNQVDGVFLNATCDRNTLTSNTISSNIENGVFLLDHCTSNILTENIIESNIGTGFKLENSSSNNLSSNQIENNLEYGVLVTGSTNTLWENTIGSNQRHGVFLFADDNTVVTRNTIQENTYEGIRAYNSTSDTITKNIITGNTRYGIYMDFFTMNNLIYNNIFSENTDQNALDKSIDNRNQWNISKTSGENIIHGSYLGGNYWDDYVGPDNDSDGLGNTPYTIFGSNYDHLPLIDVTPPVITSVSRTPSVQTTQDYVTISAQVTDDLHLADVRLIIIDPNQQTTNFSIKQNKTGDVYSSQNHYTVVGTYTFYIGAADSRNWAPSSNYTFIIQQGIPPTIVDNSPTTGSPNRSFVFNATVTDDTDGPSTLTVKVQWHHGSYSGNYSMVNIRGNYFEMDVHLDKSIEDLTYNFYACDQWGNAVVTTQKSVNVIDTEPPSIVINKYGSSSDDLPNSFTFGATITDNFDVTNVSIEYWYSGSEHFTVPMDRQENYYQKVIIPEGSPENVSCIIFAADSAGNTNNTKKPFAIMNDASYRGVVTIPLMFNASKSFDLDGSIVSYDWVFGDGTTGTGVAPTHTYLASGNYTVTLTITDNDGNTGNTSTWTRINILIKKETSQTILDDIKQDYGVTLNDVFYSYDLDGDSIVDTFVDPNNVLTAVHEGFVNISGNAVFLISVNDTAIPEFLWNSATDEIFPITHKIGVVNNTIKDEEHYNATIYILVNKINGWMCLEAPDEYPTAKLVVYAGDKTIAPDRIWRKNNNIYLLDDPDTEYRFFYENYYQPPVLEQPVFTPVDGGVINEEHPTLSITYNVAVTIKDAAFGDLILTESDFTTTDNQIFTYTPPGYLKDKTYEFTIFVEDEQGHFLESNVIFFYFSYTTAQTETGLPLMWISGGIIAIVGCVIVLILRRKHITLDFVYMKNKKIALFPKPVVIGPVSIKIDDERISKAEFYVDGTLKETLTAPPYYWKWDERTVMKHALETKIYDAEGNSSSSGSFEVLVFNPIGPLGAKNR